MGKFGSTREGEIMLLRVIQTPTGNFCWRFLLSKYRITKLQKRSI
jgi:hypothetical protein